jgi:molybdenum cofactor cytidylyltransferase
MGTQKALLPFASGTVISHITDQFIQSAVDEVFVVVGHDPEQIKHVLTGPPVTIVHNPDYEEGMLSSVRAGLRALPDHVEETFIALGDQPAISSALINTMLDAFSQTGKGMMVPLHQDRRGHPLLLSPTYRAEILTHFDDQGLRGLLHTHPEDVAEVPVDTDGGLHDIDTPEDYQRAVERLRHDNG